MSATVEDGRYIIVWEERRYRPFCVISKRDCGKQLGYINGERDDRVYEYMGYHVGEWIANYLTVDGGAILYRAEGVTDTPEGLRQEYN